MYGELSLKDGIGFDGDGWRMVVEKWSARETRRTPVKEMVTAMSFERVNVSTWKRRPIPRVKKPDMEARMVLQHDKKKAGDEF